MVHSEAHLGTMILHSTFEDAQYTRVLTFSSLYYQRLDVYLCIDLRPYKPAHIRPSVSTERKRLVTCQPLSYFRDGIERVREYPITHICGRPSRMRCQKTHVDLGRILGWFARHGHKLGHC